MWKIEIITPLALFLCFAAERTDGIECYTCQYSDNAGLVGYECVNNPAGYTLGPATGTCENGCQTLQQITLSTGTVYYAWRGCKAATSPDDGCTSDVYYRNCRHSCDDADLCNVDDLSAPTTPVPSSTEPVSTVSTTTTTEMPGTRWCYSCVYSYHPEGDDSCVTDAANAPEPNDVRCPPTRVCTTFRQWDKGNDVMRSFARGCEEQQGAVDRCVEDTYFTTCFTYCQEEYCNSGDGIPG